MLIAAPAGDDAAADALVAVRDDVGDAAERDADAGPGARAGRPLLLPVADLEVDEGDVAPPWAWMPSWWEPWPARAAVDVPGDVDVVRVELHAQGVVDPALRAAVALDVEDEVDRLGAVAAAALVRSTTGPRRSRRRS